MALLTPCAPPRSRTSSCSFEDCRAFQHTRKANRAWKGPLRKNRRRGKRFAGRGSGDKCCPHKSMIRQMLVSTSRLPRRCIARTVHHGEQLNSVSERDVVDDVTKLSQPHRSNVLPNDTEQLRRSFDSLENRS